MKVKPTITTQELPDQCQKWLNIRWIQTQMSSSFSSPCWIMRIWCLRANSQNCFRQCWCCSHRKKVEALELLELTESTLVADVCKLSKLEYFTWYQVFKISKTFPLTFQKDEFCTTQLQVYLSSYTLPRFGWKWRDPMSYLPKHG